MMRWTALPGALAVACSHVGPARSGDAATHVAPCAAFVDVTVVPMDTERLLPHQTVLVRGDRIEDVAPADSLRVAPACVTIDGRHRYLIPGLIDSHLHLSYGATGAGEGDARVEGAVFAMLLANGITTAVNMQGSPRILKLRDDIARGELRGPRLFSASPYIQMPNSGEAPGARTFTTAEQTAAEVRADKAAGYDFVKVHGDLPEPAYRALLETAMQEHIPVVGHVPSNLGIDAALQGHQALIVHAEEYINAFFTFQRSLPTDPAEIDRMVRDVAARTAKAGTWVSPTLYVFRQIITQLADLDAMLQRPEVRYLPSSATVDWFPPRNPYARRMTVEKIPALRAQFAIMQQLVRGLRDAGVPLLAGTDPMAPCVLPGFSLADELRELVEAGLTPYEALQAATSNPARFLRLGAGVVARGDSADLVLLEADPLQDVANTSRQAGVMLRGRWLTEDALRAELSGNETASR